MNGIVFSPGSKLLTTERISVKISADAGNGRKISAEFENVGIDLTMAAHNKAEDGIDPV